MDCSEIFRKLSPHRLYFQPSLNSYNMVIDSSLIADVSNKTCMHYCPCLTAFFPFLQINVSSIVKEMRLQRHGMIQTKVSASRRVKSSGFGRDGYQKVDVSFVPVVSGAVPLLLQSLVRGFTGDFAASQQPVAARRPQRPQSSLRMSSPPVHVPVRQKL